MRIEERLTKEARGGSGGRPEYLTINAEEARELSNLARSTSLHGSAADVEEMIFGGDMKWMGIPIKVSA